MLTFCLLLVVGCRVEDTHDDTGFEPPGGDDTGGSTDDTGTGDDTATDDTGDSPIDIPDGLTFRLHDEIESLAYIGWEQESAGTTYVEYSFDKGDWLQTPEKELEAGAHEELLLGIPFDTTFSFRVVGPEGTSEEGTATTGALPLDMLAPTIWASSPTEFGEDDKYLILSVNEQEGGWTTGPFWKIIIDRRGRVVWAHLTPDNHWSIFLRVSVNGEDLLWDDATFWSDWDEGAGSRVHRTRIDLTEVATYDTPGLHHAFTELPDGTLAWGAASWTSETLQELSPEGVQSQVWDCTDLMDDLGWHDSCQSNTLFFDEDSSSYIYSFYTTDSVLRIDRSTGETTAIWGHLPTAWAFDPTDSLFYWQHGANITGDGTLLLSTYRESTGVELVAREYEINEADKTLTEVWNFGLDEGIFGSTAGEAHRLSNGDTLHNYGSASRVREVTPDGDIVWDVAWPDNHLIGRSTFIADLYDLAP